MKLAQAHALSLIDTLDTSIKIVGRGENIQDKTGIHEPDPHEYCSAEKPGSQEKSHTPNPANSGKFKSTPTKPM